MKKYLLTLGIGALILSSGCDPMNQDNLPSDELSTLDRGSNMGEENLRKENVEVQWKVEEAENAYRLMENAYSVLLSQFPKEEVERERSASRSKEAFVESMIKKSIRVFDENIEQKGRFLSAQTLRNHQQMAGDEHEIEYDILAFGEDEQASMAGYLKIEDIKGESTEQASFNFAKVKLFNSGVGKANGCDWCNDSLPPIKMPQIEEIIEFLIEVERSNADPSQTNAGLLELEFGGLNPVQAALLLPAVQKVREAARINARGKADILIESFSSYYGLELGNEKGKFLRYGGLGSIGALIESDYDDSGDLDWASVQIHRGKFELEMLFLWSRFWEAHTVERMTNG
jgi:hypothetical protein